MQADYEYGGTPAVPISTVSRNNEFEQQTASMQHHDMSDRDDENLIRNEDTAARRAWVERALESVRRHLQSDDEPPLAEKPADRPSLFVVRPGPKR